MRIQQLVLNISSLKLLVILSVEIRTLKVAQMYVPPAQPTVQPVMLLWIIVLSVTQDMFIGRCQPQVSALKLALLLITTITTPFSVKHVTQVVQFVLTSQHPAHIVTKTIFC